ncbi:MAG: outer membrane beta-barrel protein [Candidatus Sulfotelmatobacter sp.]
MRKFALLASACAVLLFANVANAQKGDVTVSGSTLMSATNPSDVATFQPLTEKQGTYVGLGADIFNISHHIGLNVDSSWRYKQESYYGYENYRPIFVSANALYESKVSRKVEIGVVGGIGVASNRFDLLTSCGTPGCVNYNSSNHFMEDLGIGVRYYVWHRIPHIFVRPEVRYYHIQDNQGFNSSNVFRLGVSVGYTIGKRPVSVKAKH